jgi:ATP-dependent Zn protease
VFLGGRAADKIINGAPTTGAGSDLANVTEMMWRKHLNAGLGDSLMVEEKSDAPPAVRVAVEKDINRSNACAEAIISANRPAIAAIADAIMAKPPVRGERTLTKDEYKAILAERKIALPEPEKGKDGPCDFTP